MGKHTLESNKSNQWRPSVTTPGEFRHALRGGASVESSVATIKDERFARDLGETTVNAAFNAIVENFEVKRPTIKERLQKFGKNILKLVKSARFEYPETQQMLFSPEEKQALFAADRERAKAQARQDIAVHFKPRQTEAGNMIVEGQVEAIAPILTREQEDDQIVATMLHNEGLNYEEQADYRALYEREAASLQSKNPTIHLLAGERFAWPQKPLTDRQETFYRLARHRASADAAEYAKRNIPVINNMYTPPSSKEAPADEFLGLTK